MRTQASSSSDFGVIHKAVSQPDLLFDQKKAKVKHKPTKKHSMQSTFDPIPEDGLMKQHKRKKRMAKSSTDLYLDEGLWIKFYHGK